MLKFPSIDSFRHAVATVKRHCDHHNLSLPVLHYTGHVKLHGTNAGICVNLNERTLVPQSREHELSVQSDNAGFAAYVLENQEALLNYFHQTMGTVDAGSPFTVYGEWCGGNIQKNVALNQLPKQFVVFSVIFHDENVYNDDGSVHTQHYGSDFFVNKVYDFDSNEYVGVALPPGLQLIHEIVPPVHLSIDFNAPDKAVAELERLTKEYEDCCPYAKHFGVEGIGEGLVWTVHALDVAGLGYPLHLVSRLWFKTKGEKHGNKGTNNTVKVAVAAERIEDFNALIERILPEWRLEQGLAVLREQGVELSRTNTGAYVKWVTGDVFKEEADTVVASGFDAKPVGGEVAKRASQWFRSRPEVL